MNAGPNLLRLKIVTVRASKRKTLLRAKLSALLLCFTLIQSFHARVPGGLPGGGSGHQQPGDATSAGPRQSSSELRIYDGSMRACTDKRGSFQPAFAQAPARLWHHAAVCLGLAETVQVSASRFPGLPRFAGRAPPHASFPVL